MTLKFISFPKSALNLITKCYLDIIILEIIFDRKLVFTFPCIPHNFIRITYFLQTTTVFYSLLLQGIKSQVKRAYDTKIHMVQRFGKQQVLSTHHINLGAQKLNIVSEICNQTITHIQTDNREPTCWKCISQCLLDKKN